MLLIAVLFCGISGCTRTAPSVCEGTYHTELSFPELRDFSVQAALEIARARELLFRIERGEIGGVHAQNLLDARKEAFENLRTETAIAYVRYCRDVTNKANKETYDTLAVQSEELSCILVDAALLLSKDSQ